MMYTLFRRTVKNPEDESDEPEVKLRGKGGRKIIQKECQKLVFLKEKRDSSCTNKTMEISTSSSGTHSSSASNHACQNLRGLYQLNRKNRGVEDDVSQLFQKQNKYSDSICTPINLRQEQQQQQEQAAYDNDDDNDTTVAQSRVVSTKTTLTLEQQQKFNAAVASLKSQNSKPSYKKQEVASKFSSRGFLRRDSYSTFSSADGEGGPERNTRVALTFSNDNPDFPTEICFYRRPESGVALPRRTNHGEESKCWSPLDALQKPRFLLTPGDSSSRLEDLCWDDDEDDDVMLFEPDHSDSIYGDVISPSSSEHEQRAFRVTPSPPTSNKNCPSDDETPSASSFSHASFPSATAQQHQQIAPPQRMPSRESHTTCASRDTSVGTLRRKPSLGMVTHVKPPLRSKQSYYRSVARARLEI